MTTSRDSGPGLELTQCHRDGGEVITVYGENFGSRGALILVGGRVCQDPAHNISSPHSTLTCTLLPGTGVSLRVSVLQAFGGLDASPGQPVVSYEQCGAGEELSQDRSLCVPCGMGLFSTGGGAPCTPCGPGTYGGTDREDASACSQCSPGFFQPSPGQAVCTPCEAGRFSPGSGATECLRCPSGSIAAESGASTCQQCPEKSDAALNEEGNFLCACRVGYYGVSSNASSVAVSVQGEEGSSVYPVSCLACPRGSLCNMAGLNASTITPAEGWWKAVDTSTADISADGMGTVRFYQCTGPTDCTPQGCAAFRKGPLCALCQDGYLESFGSCQPCPSVEGSITLSALFALFCLMCLMGLFALIVRSDMRRYHWSGKDSVKGGRNASTRSLSVSSKKFMSVLDLPTHTESMHSQPDLPPHPEEVVDPEADEHEETGSEKGPAAPRVEAAAWELEDAPIAVEPVKLALNKTKELNRKGSSEVIELPSLKNGVDISVPPRLERRDTVRLDVVGGADGDTGAVGDTDGDTGEDDAWKSQAKLPVEPNLVSQVFSASLCVCVCVCVCVCLVLSVCESERLLVYYFSFWLLLILFAICCIRTCNNY